MGVPIDRRTVAVRTVVRAVTDRSLVTFAVMWTPIVQGFLKCWETKGGPFLCASGFFVDHSSATARSRHLAIRAYRVCSEQRARRDRRLGLSPCCPFLLELG